MLQPRQTGEDQQLFISRILWGALSFSTILYGLVLYSTRKITGVYSPVNDLLPLEQVAVVMNFMALLVYFFYKGWVLPQQDFQKKFPGYIVCWALNESIAMTGFLAVFVSENGNGFFYLTNLAVALIGNLLTFPKK